VPDGLAGLPATPPMTPNPEVPQTSPPDGAIPAGLGQPGQALSPLGDWFQVGGHGIAHLDPSTVRADTVLTTDACSVAQATTTDDAAAALACETIDPSSQDRTGCAVLVTSLADGEEIGRWAFDDGTRVTSFTLDGDAVVAVTSGHFTGRQPDGWQVLPLALRFDATTGEGTSMTTTCNGDPISAGGIERTSLIQITCSRNDQANDVVDVRTGSVLGRLPYTGSPDSVRSDGVVLIAADGTRYDADTFATLDPTRPAPRSPAGDGWSGSITTPDGAMWAWHTDTTEEATGYLSDTLSSIGIANGAIVLLDETGAEVERWPATTTYTSSRSGVNVRSPLIAADDTGAWIASGSELYRLNR
jgi:hypothetical protein